jgi:hypothetical protein
MSGKLVELSIVSFAVIVAEALPTGKSWSWLRLEFTETSAIFKPCLGDTSF